MKCIHIITPVKDSIELTLQTVEAVMASGFQIPFTYTVYNDFSTEENTAKLQEASGRLGFERLVFTRRLVLQTDGLTSLPELSAGAANGATACH